MNDKMNSETNALNWFEIPAIEISRAQKFYEDIFEIKMEEMEMPDMKYAMFPVDPMKGRVGGALAQSPMHVPSATGSIIYLNGNPDLQKVLDRIENAGGEITMQKTSIGPNGFMAFFSDTEGNMMALHSNT